MTKLPPDLDGESETALATVEKMYEIEPPASAKNGSWPEDSKLRLLKFCEVLILIPIMLVIVGLLLIPTAFYAPNSQQQVRFLFPPIRNM